MRFLIFSDVHGNRRSVDIASRLVEKEGAEATFFLGDLSSGKNLGEVNSNLKDAEYFINKFEGKKLYALFGNCDVPETRDLFEDRGIGLHNRAIGIKGLSIVGIGGSNATPFHTPSEFAEAEINEMLETLFKKAAKFETERILLFSHFPPKNTKCDMIESGAHVGSESIRAVIEKHQPNLCLCSHIHEAKSEDVINKTRVVNIGPASEGNFTLLDIDGNITIKSIKI